MVRLGYHPAAMSRRPAEEYRSEPPLANLEDDWIAEADRDPGDIDWFLAVVDAFHAAGEGERVRGLIEVWDDELRERGLWAARLEVLRRVGDIAYKPSRLYREVVTTLEGLWSGKPNLAATIEWVGLHKTVEDATKLWDRVTRLGSVLRYDVGEVVAMKGHGVGRVAEVNLALESLRIDFEKTSGVTLGFRAAAKMLRHLEAGHLLRRKIEDPEGLARLRDEQPSELLRVVLEDADHALSAAEVREALTGIVSPKQWTSWWSAARRHPQVVTVGTGRQTYAWEASASGALDAVRRSFDRAEPRQRVEIFRKNLDRDPAMAREFAGDLASVAGEAEASDPGLAWEIYFALERAGLLPASHAGLVDRLLDPERDPRPLLAGIQDRLLRERALVMARERREDWPAIYRDQFLRDDDPRVLSLVADGLSTAANEIWDRLVDDLLAQPRRAPGAFTWLAERAADDEALRTRAPQRMLQQLVAALGSDEFSGLQTRLRPLVESGGTLPRLLPLLDEAQAKAAIELLRRTPALASYQRDSLVTALQLRYQGLDDSSAAGPLYATAAAIDARREELKRLAEIEIPKNRKAIEEARALGDLRENFEYKSARQRHEYLNARVATLHRDLGRARPIDFAQLDVGEVRIGAAIALLPVAGGAERRFVVLGPWDSRPERGIISYESELGQNLLGHKVGDAVQVGDTSYRIKAISRGD